MKKQVLEENIQHVFIIGSKGIPASYGGFETFVDKLTEGKSNSSLQYHVACMEIEDTKKEDKIFYYNDAECFKIKVPSIGAAKAVYYDVSALNECINIIEKRNISNAIIYILACRIGPFIGLYKKTLKKFGIKLYINPDGHEWKRDKWNGIIKKYWKFSEKLMVKNADLLICDSVNIENYIVNEYKDYHPQTTYIAYGTDLSKSKLTNDDEKLKKWFEEKNVKPNEYYLVVGRFVPENNYETMISEFMNSNTKRDFVLITNVEKNKFYEQLRIKTNFENDSRIKFVGTVYDSELLKIIRENAFAYFHGHEVGGTNPSLLESLGSTKINLLINVGFNREVAADAALYWDKLSEFKEKKEKSLRQAIWEIEELEKTEEGKRELDKFAIKAQNRIKEAYSWDFIIDEYERLFGSKVLENEKKKY